MGARREGRIAAVQALYAFDLADRSASDIQVVLAGHFDHLDPEASTEAREFAEYLCVGTCRELGRIDALIEQASQHWRIERMGRVELGLLRLGAFELLRGEATVAVVINEAVEIADQYAADGASSFINGVLQRIDELLKQAAPASSASPAPTS